MALLRCHSQYVSPVQLPSSVTPSWHLRSTRRSLSKTQLIMKRRALIIRIWRWADILHSNLIINMHDTHFTLYHDERIWKLQLINFDNYFLFVNVIHLVLKNYDQKFLMLIFYDNFTDIKWMNIQINVKDKYP